jgi:hypothetical protein
MSEAKGGKVEGGPTKIRNPKIEIRSNRETARNGFCSIPVAYTFLKQGVKGKKTDPRRAGKRAAIVDGFWVEGEGLQALLELAASGDDVEGVQNC